MAGSPASPTPSRGSPKSLTPSPISPKKRLESLSLRRVNPSSIRQRPSQRLTQTSSRKSDSIGQESSLPSQQSQASQRSTSSDVLRMPKDSYNNVSPVVTVVVNKDVDNEDLSEEEMDRRRNIEKCMNWIEKLPAKFSSMHIAQERAAAAN